MTLEFAAGDLCWLLRVNPLPQGLGGAMVGRWKMRGLVVSIGVGGQ